MNLFRRFFSRGYRQSSKDSDSSNKEFGRTPDGDAMEHSIIEALKSEIMSQAHKLDYGFKIVFSYDVEITSCHLERLDAPGHHIENEIDIEDYTERLEKISNYHESRKIKPLWNELVFEVNEEKEISHFFHWNDKWEDQLEFFWRNPETTKEAIIFSGMQEWSEENPMPIQYMNIPLDEYALDVFNTLFDRVHHRLGKLEYDSLTIKIWKKGGKAWYQINLIHLNTGRYLLFDIPFNGLSKFASKLEEQFQQAGYPDWDLIILREHQSKLKNYQFLKDNSWEEKIYPFLIQNKTHPFHKIRELFFKEGIYPVYNALSIFEKRKKSLIQTGLNITEGKDFLKLLVCSDSQAQ